MRRCCSPAVLTLHLLWTRIVALHFFAFVLGIVCLPMGLRQRALLQVHAGKGVKNTWRTAVALLKASSYNEEHMKRR
jgi:hypothetical protein